MNYPNDDISLKQVFLRVGSYLRAGSRNWYWILLGGMLFAVLFAFFAMSESVTYESKVTFVVNEDSPAGGGGGVGAILGQFGLGGGGTDFNLEKIIALAKSQKMVNELLLDSLKINDKEDLVANHLLEVYNLTEEWELEDSYPGFKITANEIDKLNRTQRRVLKSLFRYSILGGDALIKITAEDVTGILSITAVTEDEELSLQLSERLYSGLSNFYTKESTGSSKATVNKLQSKADSIYRELSSAEYQLAAMLDTRLGITQKRNLVRQSQLNRKVNILSLAYGEVVRNLETANFALSNKTPFFQIVDAPFLPLPSNSVNVVERAIIGLLIGMIVVFSIIAIFHFYREVMSS